jgi:DNA polymerase-3 subunit gamma/tau
MGQALYRKYRSKSLAEIVGQEHITTTLDNALKKGAISHAYLFTGPRGVGKTSIARILAHEVNGLPYDEQGTHLDIIEIDAASNRRIDEIRELRDRVHVSPTSAKYKVYIIDEVHMLTREAFNALLKTLEEPPAHAIFILATTEAHKLPETIVSRTQRYTFRPIDHSKAVKHLKSIAKQEKIHVEDDALELIARHGGGSFRDSISLLDQARNQADTVTLQHVQAMLGIAPEEAINGLLTILNNNDLSGLVRTLQELREHGYHAAGLAKQLSARLRQSLITGNIPMRPERITRLLARLIDVPASHDPDTLLEIILVESIQPQTPAAKQSDDPPAKPAPADAPPQQSVKTETRPSRPKPKPAQTVPQPAAIETPVTPTGNGALNEDIWLQALQAIKQKHNTLYGIARMAAAEFAGNRLTLIFAFPFHQKRLSEAKNQQVIADTLANLLGSPVEIECIVDKNHTKKPSKSKESAVKPATNDPMDTISNIFGGAELLG